MFSPVLAEESNDTNFVELCSEQDLIIIKNIFPLLQKPQKIWWEIKLISGCYIILSAQHKKTKRQTKAKVVGIRGAEDPNTKEQLGNLPEKYMKDIKIEKTVATWSVIETTISNTSEHQTRIMESNKN